MKHCSLYLPDDLYEQLRARAFHERRSQNEIVVTGLIRYLGGEPKVQAKPAPRARRKRRA
jgi:hypothetical protein